MTPWSPPKLPDTSHRLNADLSVADINLLRSVLPNYGLLSTICQTFFHDLAQYIRANGYTYADYETVLTYIHYRTDSGFVNHPYTPINRGPVEVVHANPKTPTHVKSGSTKTASSGQRDKTARKG
jgi:hypothetical protein